MQDIRQSEEMPGLGSKTERLNKLFEKWQERNSTNNPELQSGFKLDGIINEQEFNKQEKKLLFIAKEPNDPEWNGGDYRKEWPDKANYRFADRIAALAYGCLNDFPPLSDYRKDEATNKSKMLQAVAFMNLKKTGGGGQANNDLIANIISNEKDLIIQEIEIIEPDIIIGGIGINSPYWKILFNDELSLENCGYDVRVGTWRKTKVIEFYHPSIRATPAMLYCLLQQVMSSHKYGDL